MSPDLEPFRHAIVQERKGRDVLRRDANHVPVPQMDVDLIVIDLVQEPGDLVPHVVFDQDTDVPDANAPDFRERLRIPRRL